MCVQEVNPLPLNVSETHSKYKVSEFESPKGVTLPDSVDWRTGGAVTHVKDQVSCYRLQLLIDCGMSQYLRLYSN